MNNEILEMKNLAFRHLNNSHRVLASHSEASVEWCDFNPFRAVQVIAIVKWPAVVNMRNVVLEYPVLDGASINN